MPLGWESLSLRRPNQRMIDEVLQQTSGCDCLTSMVTVVACCAACLKSWTTMEPSPRPRAASAVNSKTQDDHREHVRGRCKPCRREQYNHGWVGSTEDAPPLPSGLQRDGWVLDHNRMQVRVSPGAGARAVDPPAPPVFQNTVVLTQRR